MKTPPIVRESSAWHGDRKSRRNEEHSASHRCAACHSARRLSKQASRRGTGRVAGSSQPASGHARVVGRAEEDRRGASQIHTWTGLRRSTRRSRAGSKLERLLESARGGLPKSRLRVGWWVGSDRSSNAATGPNPLARPGLPSAFSGRRFRRRALDLRGGISRAFSQRSSTRYYMGRADQPRACGWADYCACCPPR